MPVKQKLTGLGTPPDLARYIAGVANGNPASGLTAAGSTQGTALLLTTADISVITTAGSGTGVILPPGTASGDGVSVGDTITVVNYGLNAVLVYPPTNGKIQNGSANAGFSVGSNKEATFRCLDNINFSANLSA